MQDDMMISDVNLGINSTCIMVLIVLFLSIRLDEKDSRSTFLFKALMISTIIFIAFDFLQFHAMDNNLSKMVMGPTYFISAIAEFASYSLLCMYYFSVNDALNGWKDLKIIVLIVFCIMVVAMAFTAMYDGTAFQTDWEFFTTAELTSDLIALPLLLILADSILRAVHSVYPADRMECLLFSIFVIQPLVMGFGLAYFIDNYTVECMGITVCLVLLTIHRVNHSIVTDPFNGFRLRFLMMPFLEKSFEKNKGGPGVVIAVTDVDRFKLIVETVGHSNATKVLQEVSDAIKLAIKGFHCTLFSSISSSDEIFLIMQHGTREQMEEIRRRINTILEEKSRKLPYELHISMGIAVQTADTKEPQQLFDESDEDMYIQKQAYYAEKGYTRRK